MKHFEILQHNEMIIILFLVLVLRTRFTLVKYICITEKRFLKKVFNLAWNAEHLVNNNHFLCFGLFIYLSLLLRFLGLLKCSAWGQDNSYRGRGPNITRHNYCWFTRIAHSFYQEYKNVYITSYTYINSWREHEKVHDIIIS